MHALSMPQLKHNTKHWTDETTNDVDKKPKRRKIPQENYCEEKVKTECEEILRISLLPQPVK